MSNYVLMPVEVFQVRDQVVVDHSSFTSSFVELRVQGIEGVAPPGPLVYANGNGQARLHVVRASSTRLHVHALDLELLPKDLLTQVAAVAASMRAARAAVEHVDMSAHVG